MVPGDNWITHKLSMRGTLIPVRCKRLNSLGVGTRNLRGAEKANTARLFLAKLKNLLNLLLEERCGVPPPATYRSS
jgi:hypothetical protein